MSSPSRTTGAATELIAHPIEQFDLLRQADLLKRDLGAFLDIGRQHGFRRPKQKGIGDAGDPALVEARQHVMCHVLLVPDRATTWDRPRDGGHHGRGVLGLAGQDGISHRVFEPG